MVDITVLAMRADLTEGAGRTHSVCSHARKRNGAEKRNDWSCYRSFQPRRIFTYGNKIITLFFVGNKIITYLCRVIKNR